jgi:hypothetical protein
MTNVVCELNQVDSKKSPWNLSNLLIHDEYRIGQSQTNVKNQYLKRGFYIILQFCRLSQIIVRLGLSIVNYLGLIANWDFWNLEKKIGVYIFSRKGEKVKENATYD